MANKKIKLRNRFSDRVGTASHGLSSELSEAVALVRDGKRKQALALALDLERRHPNRMEVLVLLGKIYADLALPDLASGFLERLRGLMPHEPQHYLLLASSYANARRPVMALHTLHDLETRLPDHPYKEQAAKLSEVCVNLAAYTLQMQGLNPEDIGLLALHEHAQILLARGSYPEARKAVEDLLARRPDFPPALCTLSMLLHHTGEPDQALATARRALSLAPDDLHAHASLIHLLCLGGRPEEATALGQRLKALPAEGLAVATRKAEALSMLGDDRGVLETLAPGAEGYPLHFAAVAALRLGDEETARRHWLKLRAEPQSPQVAEDNWEDLQLPPAERSGPRAFPASHWMSEATVGQLSRLLETQWRAPAADPRPVEKFLLQHPEMPGLVPILLDRGDPQGRALALGLAVLGRTPELVAALRGFVLGQRGTDSLRLDAAQRLVEGGAVQPGPMRMWLEGEWQETLILNQEILDEPESTYSQEVLELSGEAHALLDKGEPREAEALIKKALELVPDAPDLLNNLAAAYSMMGRKKEAHDIVRRNHALHPDYAFGRAAMARVLLKERRPEAVDEAAAVLEPLRSMRRLHRSEFAALCQAQIELHLARQQPKQARSWLRLFAQALPEHPRLSSYRALVERRQGR